MGVLAKVTIILDGENHQVDLDESGDTILETAKKMGIDPPFSCQGGVCTTCMCKVTEGKVKMDMNYALTDQEIEEGFALTCQSHPITETVVIDYDDV